MPARPGRPTVALIMKCLGGQEAECCLAIPILENVKATAVLADKGYDTNALREWLKEQGIKAVIPPKSNRKEQIVCDYHHYKERHAIECLFGKLKHYRRIAKRYKTKSYKLLRNIVVCLYAFMITVKRQQNLYCGGFLTILIMAQFGFIRFANESHILSY